MVMFMLQFSEFYVVQKSWMLLVVSCMSWWIAAIPGWLTTISSLTWLVNHLKEAYRLVGEMTKNGLKPDAMTWRILVCNCMARKIRCMFFWKSMLRI